MWIIKYGMIFHVNHLLADDSHEVSRHIVFLYKAIKIENVLCCKYLSATYKIELANKL